MGTILVCCILFKDIEWTSPSGSMDPSSAPCVYSPGEKVGAALFKQCVSIVR